ncbi:MAG TPA: hypothetical protein DCE23_05350 [Firmicutes bacterium]|nr:hypothetical protein [Bacillota bacterium]
MIDKKIEELLIKICCTLELGEPSSVEKYDNRDDMYKATIGENIYIIKQYNKEDIKDELEVNSRKLQISVFESLSQNGVPTIIPCKFDNRYFIRYRKTYFLIYKYLPCELISKKDYEPKKIKKVATTLAIIHKLNFKSILPESYQTVNIDFNKYLDKFKKIDENLYNALYENIFNLEQLVNNYNSSLKYVQNYLCISLKNYNYNNIYWDKDYVYLADYNNVVLANPAACLAEVAYTFALEDDEINEDTYKEFLKAYIKKYGPLITDYQQALSVASSSKIEDLIDAMGRCSKNDTTSNNETIHLIRELTLYQNYIDRFYELYLSVVKK